MNTKLTLSLDKEIIEKAKEVSKKNGKSLSKLIEDYLKLFISKEITNKQSISISEALSGIMEEPKAPYRTEKEKHILNKHA